MKKAPSHIGFAISRSAAELAHAALRQKSALAARHPIPVTVTPSSSSAPIDLLVIGGGINGTGIARDAAGRGLSVTLVERGDLAGATSSYSSKLVHGGLRYLEQFEFRLVAEALAERETLLRMAPRWFHTKSQWDSH